MVVFGLKISRNIVVLMICRQDAVFELNSYITRVYENILRSKRTNSWPEFFVRYM